MLKLLVVGAGGQVGEKIGHFAARSQFHTLGCYKARSPGSGYEETFPLDKTDTAAVDALLTRERPDIVVDTAALHNVDYCEAHLDEAMSVNRDGTENLARSTSKVGGKFVFISTDFVFDGDQGFPYTENQAPNPQSVYARSKLEGERAALALNPNTAICRPSVIYSCVDEIITSSSSSSGKPLNFGAWLVSQLKLQKEIKIVTDQIASPTLADDLARAILAIAKSSTAVGVFHTAGSSPLSRYDFSVKLAAAMGLDENLVLPISTASLNQVAKRPKNSSLASNRLNQETGYTMMDIDKALNIFSAQYSSLRSSTFSAFS